MSLLHAALHEVGPEGSPVDVLVVNRERAAGVRGLAGSPSLCVDEADPFREAQRRLFGRVYRSVDGRLRGLLDRRAPVDRLHDVTQGG